MHALHEVPRLLFPVPDAGCQGARGLRCCTPVATPYALAAHSPKNQERILAQRPHASDVRGFHAWLNVGRVVRKGEKGIKIVTPVMGGDGNVKVVNIKPPSVFDVTQTDERTPRAA